MEKSVDSIGSCSLDAEFSTDFSDTSESLNFVSPSATRGDFTQGISERCRRTHQPLPLVPKIIMNQPIFENSSSTSRVTTTAMYDVDSGKFFSSVDSQTKETSGMYTNGSSEKYLTSNLIELQSPAVVAHANKKPSYLNLACCVNGYSNYTNYDSAERKEINKSREASPIPPLMSISRQQRSNDRVYPHSVVTKKESPSSSLGLVRRFAEFNIHEKDITDNAGAGLHQTPETKKSFIQQRVEKLYGTSNILTHPNISHNGGIKSNTPVVVENKIEKVEAHLDLPVLKHLRPEFRNKLTFVSPPKNIQISPISTATASEFQEKAKSANLKKETSAPITIEKINLTKGEEESEKPVEIKNGNMENGNSHKTTATDANPKDGHYFLKLLSDEKTRILNMADIAENNLTKKQSEENAAVPEEVVGLVLAAIGKARLLATKKFKQFEGLCHVNINPNEDGPQTLCDDLQGFWDMMMLQVDNLEIAFKEVQDCIENDWKKPQEPDPAPPKGSRLVKRPLTQSNTSKSKSNVTVKKSLPQSNSEAAQKREDQRKKLIEMKRRQKAAIHTADDELISMYDEKVEGSSNG